MRILHVAPTAFGHDGLFGGGEHYPLELAHALALVDGVRCELVTFGREARVQEHDRCESTFCARWATSVAIRPNRSPPRWQRACDGRTRCTRTSCAACRAGFRYFWIVPGVSPWSSPITASPEVTGWACCPTVQPIPARVRVLGQGS